MTYIVSQAFIPKQAILSLGAAGFGQVFNLATSAAITAVALRTFVFVTAASLLIDFLDKTCEWELKTWIPMARFWNDQTRCEHDDEFSALGAVFVSMIVSYYFGLVGAPVAQFGFIALLAVVPAYEIVDKGSNLVDGLFAEE